MLTTEQQAAMEAADNALDGILRACDAMNCMAGNEISGNGAISGTTVQWFADQIKAAAELALGHLDPLRLDLSCRAEGTP